MCGNQHTWQVSNTLIWGRDRVREGVWGSLPVWRPQSFWIRRLEYRCLIRLARSCYTGRLLLTPIRRTPRPLIPLLNVAGAVRMRLSSGRWLRNLLWLQISVKLIARCSPSSHSLIKMASFVMNLAHFCIYMKSQFKTLTGKLTIGCNFPASRITLSSLLGF